MTCADPLLQLKTQFVTQMSHEIRSPIASMLGIGELLLDDPTLNEEQRDLIERSVRCGDQLLELVGMVRPPTLYPTLGRS